MNIVVLVSDALRAGSLGCYGYDKATSPEMDRIAARGIRFANAFSTANSTDASFTTIFTGKYPTSHGICHHGGKVTETEKGYTTNLKFVPEVLHEHGFVTIGVDWLGKWHRWGYDFYAGVPNRWCDRREAESAPADEPGSLPDARNDYPRFLSNLQSSLSKVSPIRSRGNWYYALPPQARNGIRAFFRRCDRRFGNSLSGRKSRPIVTDSAALTDLGIEYIREYAGRKPFFLFIHYWDTHTPYTAPRSLVKDFLRQYDYPKTPMSPILRDLSGTKSGHIARKATRGRTPGTVGEIIAHYDASIRYTDSNIGRLYDTLEQIGILDDTVIVITSDHGESLGEHGIFFNHHGLYDAQVRVPLIMCHPHLGAGRVQNELVQHFDVAPTLLEMAGIGDAGIEFDGASLLELMQGETWDRRYVFAEETLLQQKRMIRDENGKYIKALNDDECLYCKRHHSRGDEFYDLRSDPHEATNIIHDTRHTVYKDELDRYIATRPKPKKGSQITFEDEDAINKRLRALGYL